MNLTNQLSLPEPIVEAIRNDDYNPGDSEFTTNQLIRPVRINVLIKKHGEQIIEDVSDRIFSLLGQAVHVILDRATVPAPRTPNGRVTDDSGRFWPNQGQITVNRWIVKKRYFVDFEGTRISGEIDVFDNETKVLSDYKLCSRYVMSDGIKPEWEAQDNMNAFLMRENGLYVGGLNIVAIYRDWSKMMAERNRHDYPERQIQVFDVKPWPEQKTIDFIRERIKANKEAEDILPLCTPKERWQVPTKWALMKKGLKRASKLYDDREQAEAAALFNNKGLPKGAWSVEERPGEEKRCKFFCSVVRYCDFGRAVIEQ